MVALALAIALSRAARMSHAADQSFWSLVDLGVRQANRVPARGGQSLRLGAEFLFLGAGRTRNRRETVGLRQSWISRQPNPLTLQGEVVRLPFAVLRSSLLHCTPLRVPGRARSCVRGFLRRCPKH